jgi:hypothetical protein
LILGLCAAFAAPSQAQQVVKVSATKAVLTNVDTAFLKLDMATDDVKSIQVVVTRLTGTAGGKAILRGSNDGVNFIAVGPDTLTLTNAVTNTKFWTLSSPLYAQYKVEVISVNGCTLSAKGYLCKRK